MSSPEKKIVSKLTELGRHFERVGTNSGRSVDGIGGHLHGAAEEFENEEHRLAQEARDGLGGVAQRAQSTSQRVEAAAAKDAEKVPLALPPGQGGITLAQARRRRGKAGGAAGEDYVRTMNRGEPETHYPVPTSNDPKYPVTGTGGRKVDVPIKMPNGDIVAVEVKTYQQYRTVKLPDGSNLTQKVHVPLSAEIKQQIHKDIALRNSDPHYDPRWEFVGAGPSDDLRQYLIDAKIIFVEHL